MVSAILLLITAYLFVINTFNYFTAGNFVSPLVPKNSLEEISKTYLHFAIILAIGLIVGFFLHKRGKYIISISALALILVLLNYFPELLV